MSRRKSFVYDMFPQDFNDGVKGLPDNVVGIYIKLINLMRVEGGPLPPRRLRLARDEFDEWLRDKLGHKNVKTWRNAKRILLADPDKLIELPGGRIANPRTERDLAGRRPREDGGEQGGGPQATLPFKVVRNDVDEPVDEPGERVVSQELPRKFGKTSMEVPSIGHAKPLKSPAIGCASPSPYIPVTPMRLQLPRLVAARARGDPAALRA